MPPESVAQSFLHAALVLLFAHVDEVIDDHPAEVAQPKLPGDLAGGLQVHLVRGFLGIVVRAVLVCRLGGRRAAVRGARDFVRA